MKKRKPHNRTARFERACGAILRTNHVAIVQIDPRDWQGLVNWKLLKRIAGSQAVADALCDIPHRWTIYVAGLCVDQSGNRYMKSFEAVPDGTYKAEHLTEVLEACLQEQVASCNPTHLVGSGWIAIPAQVSLAEEQAFQIFDLVGAWTQQKESA